LERQMARRRKAHGKGFREFLSFFNTDNILRRAYLPSTSKLGLINLLRTLDRAFF
ncbi:hypothetical protein L9F63_009059, partial [Diploptera punctata]